MKRSLPVFGLCLTLSVLLVSVAVGQSTSYTRALKAYDNQDYETAFPIWLELAADGTVSAQIALGVAYFKGEGVSRDFTESFKWFAKAAESGNVQAMFNVGTSYWEGVGVPKSHSLAVKWWQKAAGEGDPSSQYNVGIAYYLGQGAKKDLKLAAHWIQLAADNGHTGAKEILPVITQAAERAKRLNDWMLEKLCPVTVDQVLCRLNPDFAAELAIIKANSSRCAQGLGSESSKTDTVDKCQFWVEVDKDLSAISQLMQGDSQAFKDALPWSWFVDVYYEIKHIVPGDGISLGPFVSFFECERRRTRAKRVGMPVTYCKAERTIVNGRHRPRPPWHAHLEPVTHGAAVIIDPD